jgi:hypothetical protein
MTKVQNTQRQESVCIHGRSSLKVYLIICTNGFRNLASQPQRFELNSMLVFYNCLHKRGEAPFKLYISCSFRQISTKKLTTVKAHSDCVLTRVDARSVSAEYVSHVFELGIDARQRAL